MSSATIVPEQFYSPPWQGGVPLTMPGEGRGGEGEGETPSSLWLATSALNPTLAHALAFFQTISIQYFFRSTALTSGLRESSPRPGQTCGHHCSRP